MFGAQNLLCRFTNEACYYSDHPLEKIWYLKFDHKLRASFAVCINFRQRLFRLICITKSHNSRLLLHGIYQLQSENELNLVPPQLRQRASCHICNNFHMQWPYITEMLDRIVIGSCKEVH